MTTSTKRRLQAVGVSSATLFGLFFLYQALFASTNVDQARLLAEQVRDLAPGEGKEIRDQLKAKLESLSPSERRQVFQAGHKKMLEEYFKLSPKEQIAYLDKMIKNERERRKNFARARAANAKKANTKTANTKKANTKGGNNNLAGNNGFGRGNGGPGGGGPGGRGGNMSPEQR
ncbi:hypothetical protein ACYOEI_26665, partial [Singulisphaera rosea]